MRYTEFTGVLCGPDAIADAQAKACTHQYYVAGALQNHGPQDLVNICATIGWTVIAEHPRNHGGLRTWTVRSTVPPPQAKAVVEYGGYTMRLQFRDEPLRRPKQQIQKLNPGREKKPVKWAPGWAGKEEAANWVTAANGGSTSSNTNTSKPRPSSWLDAEQDRESTIDELKKQMQAIQQKLSELAV